MNIKKLIQRQHIKTDPQREDKILTGAFAELDRIAEANRRSQVVPFFTLLLHSRPAQLAAMVCVITATFMTAHFIGKPVPICSVAMAQVSQNMNNVHTFTYRYFQHIIGGREEPGKQTETVYYISPDYGVRFGTYVDGKTEQRTFVLPAEKVKITVLPEEKKYKRDELTPQTLGQVQHKNDPRELIKQFLSSEYTDLGCKVVCGIESHGIEVKNPGFMQDSMKDVVGRLWINVRTQLPVRMELEGIDMATSQRVKIVTDEFRWDASLQKEDFGPFIPEDYVLNEDAEK